MSDTNDEKKHEDDVNEFDYFDDDVQVATPQELEAMGAPPVTFESQLRNYRNKERKYLRTLILAVGFASVTAWFLSGYSDEMYYAFFTDSQPRRLGDVARFQPTDIPHNSFVELEGVTEHRGMKQKMVRGLGLNRKEFWYFRLMGSRGTFIEVEPDPEKWGYTTFVNIRGRAVDPKKSTLYGALLDEYHSRYFAKRRNEFRVIQVGIEPGDGRWVFLLVFFAFGTLAASNIWVLWNLLKARKQRLTIGRRG